MERLLERFELINLRAMFYVVTPNETSYATVEEVPNYVDKALPFFGVFMVLEVVLLKFQGKGVPPFSDYVTSLSHGIMSLLAGLLFRSAELMIYIWIHTHYCIYNLPWDSAWVWLATFILIDFLYYWFHRFGHEVNFIWAAHQVHHSSEEYNLTTALRQSVVQKYFNIIVYFPMALFIPPSIFYIHSQFNLLYQFWIHTECVNTLGPLEYILNTPSHHRVHHGRNPYCIDKNYAGTLIIWDRMFNTFEPEGVKVTYGLVHPNTFWDPIKGQLFHFFYIIGLVRSYEGLGNKVSAVFKGPGWMPGTPWRGNHEDLPEVEQPPQKYSSYSPFGVQFYVGTHFLLLLLGYTAIAPMKAHLPAFVAVSFVFFMVFSIYSFGALNDGRSFSKTLECMRCYIFLGAAVFFRGQALIQEPIGLAMTGIYASSALLWGIFLPLYEGDSYDTLPVDAEADKKDD